MMALKPRRIIIRCRHDQGAFRRAKLSKRFDITHGDSAADRHDLRLEAVRFDRRAVMFEDVLCFHGLVDQVAMDVVAENFAPR